MEVVKKPKVLCCSVVFMQFASHTKTPECEMFSLHTSSEEYFYEFDGTQVSPFALSETILRLYCDSLGLDFQYSMLNWKPVTPGEFDVWEKFADWFQIVLNSSGFKEPNPLAKTSSDLPVALHRLIFDYDWQYRDLYSRRLYTSKYDLS